MTKNKHIYVRTTCHIQAHDTNTLYSCKHLFYIYFTMYVQMTKNTCYVYYTCYRWFRLTVEVTDLVGAIAGAVVMVDGSGSVLVVPPVNSSVIAPNMEIPPTGAFPFGL